MWEAMLNFHRSRHREHRNKDMVVDCLATKSRYRMVRRARSRPVRRVFMSWRVGQTGRDQTVSLFASDFHIGVVFA